MKRLMPLIEIIVFYATLALINRFFFSDFPAFTGVAPHPYWLGILIFGYRYGVGAGALAGLAAAGLYMALSWESLDRYLFEDLSFYALPALFVVVGIVMGLLSQRSNRKWVFALDREAALNKQIAQIENELKIMQEVNRSLEKRVVTRMATLVTVYEGARQLESIHLEDLYPAILEFTSKTLDAEELSIYLKKGDNWYLKTSLGLKEYQQLPTVIGLEEGLIGESGTTGRIVSIRDKISLQPKKGATQTMGDGIFAGPIKDGEGGDVIGVVVIHKIPFLQFNSSTMSLFNFILGWASRSLGRAHMFEEMRDQEIIDPDYQVYSYRYFATRFKQEFLRSKTYYLPLSVILVEVSGLSGVIAAQKRAYLSVLSQFFKKNCRETDVIACYPGAETPFVILLVTTSEKQVSEESNRLMELYKKIEWPAFSNGKIPVFKLKNASFTPRDATTEDILGRI